MRSGLSPRTRAWSQSASQSVSFVRNTVSVLHITAFNLATELVWLKQMRHAVVELGNVIEPSCWYKRFCVALRVTAALIYCSHDELMKVWNVPYDTWGLMVSHYQRINPEAPIQWMWETEPRTKNHWHSDSLQWRVIRDKYDYNIDYLTYPSSYLILNFSFLILFTFI